MKTKQYVIQLSDHCPSGDWSPFVTSIKGDGDWEWSRDGKPAHRFDTLESAKEWASRHEWLLRPIGPSIEGYCINEAEPNAIGNIVFSL